MDNLASKNEKPYLSTNKIKIKHDHVVYALDLTQKTAGVISYEPVIDYLFIPRSIKHENEEYIVTRILEGAFKHSETVRTVEFSKDSGLKIIEKESFCDSTIESIIIPSSVVKICEGSFSWCELLQRVEFASNSELQIIEKDAFSNSSVDFISIPSSILELKEGWCSRTNYLTKFLIYEGKQKNITLFNDNLVIGKSDIKSDIFDVLLFVPRDVKNIIIPPFIKQIASYAFSNSLITNIIIPLNVMHICEGAFFDCKQLKQIKFEKDSVLQSVGKFAFSSTKIERITFPLSLSKLEEGWCEGTSLLIEVVIPPNNNYFKIIDGKFIVGKENKESDDFEVLVFVRRNVFNIIIPQNIMRIASYAFAESYIKSIIIPSNVTQICESAFSFCEHLTHVEFSPNSNLQIIGKEAFNYCSIDFISIPSHITKICEEAFYSCSKLKQVEIPSNSELQIIENKAFIHSSIETIYIPSKVTKISESSFAWCKHLQKFDLPIDSKLEIIEDKAFYSSGIKSISIPSDVIELKEGWLQGTMNLMNLNIIKNEQQNISIFDDKFVIGKSDLKSNIYDVLLFVPRNIRSITIPPFIKKIGPFALSHTLINRIFIPSNVSHICRNAFYECNQLNQIDFAEDSQLQLIGEYAFFNTLITTILIPKKVNKIDEGSFNHCLHLQNIKFAENSELKTIESKAFYDSKIDNLSIPSSVTELKEGWCHGISTLNKIIVMPNNQIYKNIDENIMVGKTDEKSDIHDSLVFVNRNIKSLTIPSSIKQIASFAFSLSSIESIIISPSVIQICWGAFYMCKKLKKVEILSNSDLQIINQYAFFGCSFNSIFLPPQIKLIGEDAFTNIDLQIVELDENSEMHSFDKRKFESEPIVMIPVKLAKRIINS